MNILVTGSAGYIGSILTERLVEEGHAIIALDNLSCGHKKAIVSGARFVQTDLSNLPELDKVFNRYQIEAVMHLAALSLVENSMKDPREYFQNNIINGINLLDTMLKHGVRKLIFSSTAAVYGEPEKVPIEENDTKVPINAYGESKLMFEKILTWYGQAYGLRFISLRYFNAAGASRRFGEEHNPETHLIPLILRIALGQGENIKIFGTDYPTPDGSCIRDYIHVLDIAKAHILALNHVEGSAGNKAYNLGNGRGYSVTEVIEATRKITGTLIPVQIHPRRQGDPTALLASSELARKDLGWQPDYPDIKDIIESAWEWQKKHPQGYGD